MEKKGTYRHNRSLVFEAERRVEKYIIDYPAPTFDRIEILSLISEIELPKLGVLEKRELKMDQLMVWTSIYDLKPESLLNCF